MLKIAMTCDTLYIGNFLQGPHSVLHFVLMIVDIFLLSYW